MSVIRVLVANRSEAVLYGAEDRKGVLRELRRFEHTEARAHDRDLTSDLPGRAFDSNGSGRHKMEPTTDPKRHEALVFARELVDYLRAGRLGGEYERLYIVAPPAFLGMLREQYDKGIEQVLSGEIDGDLVALRPEEVRKRLPDFL